jgi:hypothetical protein
MLPYWVEYLLSYNRKGSKEMGNLVSQTGVEYYAPIVPPATNFYFKTKTATMELPFYGLLGYKILFGAVVPGAFRLTLSARGRSAYDGILQGTAVEQGIDYFFCITPPMEASAYVTNLSSVNQMFQMTSQYLRIETQNDYLEALAALEQMRIPISP